MFTRSITKFSQLETMELAGCPAIVSSGRTRPPKAACALDIAVEDRDILEIGAVDRIGHD
jgi:hypothetical protein